MHLIGIDDDQLARRRDVVLVFVGEGLHPRLDDADDEIVMGMGLEGMLHVAGAHQAQIIQLRQKPGDSLVDVQIRWHRGFKVFPLYVGGVYCNTARFCIFRRAPRDSSFGVCCQSLLDAIFREAIEGF